MTKDLVKNPSNISLVKVLDNCRPQQGKENPIKEQMQKNQVLFDLLVRLRCHVSTDNNLSGRDINEKFYEYNMLLAELAENKVKTTECENYLITEIKDFMFCNNQDMVHSILKSFIAEFEKKNKFKKWQEDPSEWMHKILKNFGNSQDSLNNYASEEIPEFCPEYPLQ